MTRNSSALAVLTATALALAACGGGQDVDRSASGATAPDGSERCSANNAGGTITVAPLIHGPV